MLHECSVEETMIGSMFLVSEGQSSCRIGILFSELIYKNILELPFCHKAYERSTLPFGKIH